MKTKNLIPSLAIFFVFALASCNTDQSMVNEPKVGDVYQVECHNIAGHELAYRLVKVKAVLGDSLQLMTNKVFYQEKVYCLIEGDYFDSKASYLLSKAKIKKMYEEKNIVEVFRLYEEACLGNEK